MDKRFQVFVSSTFIDLREERAKVIQALLDEEHIPTGMELWPASNPDAWEVIRSYLRQCDYYVLIIGGRYGSTSAETGKSYTEMEYDEAVALNLPVLAFIHAEPSRLPLEKSEGDSSARQRLAQLVERVRSRHTTKSWSNGDQLQYLVSNALRRAIVQQPRVGWIRADKSIDPRVVAELEVLRRENAELKSRIEQLADVPPTTADGYADLDTSLSIPFELFIEQRSYTSSNSWNVISSTTEGRTLQTTYRDIFMRFGFASWASATTAMLEQQFSELCLETARKATSFSAGRSFAVRAEVSRQDAHQAIIQFIALGLIEQTGVKGDGDPLWTLTPYGRRQLVRMLAQCPS